MPKSSVAIKNFAPGSSRGSRSAHTLLLQMAKEAEDREDQARRITELRESRRATQPEVADAVGVSLRAYQAWEAGDSGIKGPNLKKLALYFGVAPDFIEYGSRGPSPDPFAAAPAESGDLAQLVAGLDEQVRLLRSELAARDAEVLTRIAGLQRSIQDLRDEPQP